MNAPEAASARLIADLIVQSRTAADAAGKRRPEAPIVAAGARKQPANEHKAGKTATAYDVSHRSSHRITATHRMALRQTHTAFVDHESAK